MTPAATEPTTIQPVSSGTKTAPPVTTTTTRPPSTTTTTTPAVAPLAIRNFAFLPSTLVVAVGTTVTVTNDDTVTHTWTSTTGAFTSGPLAPGASYSHTFTVAGTYPYMCTIHTFMTGTIVVQ
jgi:plastocyanin